MKEYDLRFSKILNANSYKLGFLFTQAVDSTAWVLLDAKRQTFDFRNKGGE